MISQRWRLASLFLILTNFLAFAAAQSACINSGNYSSFSTYKDNMDTLLSSLPTNVDINGFYNASRGQSPDIVYAAVLCRGDVQLEECRACIRNATAELVKSCPNYKQATHWNELCMLRYSNESMFGIMKTFPSWYWWGLKDASSPVQYKADVSRLLDKLRGQAANGGSLRKVAVGNSSSADFQIIFSLVQCTPDLSPENCSSCLIGAAAKILTYCNISISCRVLWPSCNLRYLQLPFYNETRLRELQELAMLPPQLSPPPPQPVSPPGLLQPPPPASSPPPGLPQQPASPGKKNENTVIIASVSVGVGLLVAVLAIILLIKRAKKKPKEGLEPAQPARDINVVESLQYDFSGIKAATDDFSVSTKLGQGGFGVIYKGKLTNGQDIAVKRLSLDSRQGDVEFKNEVLLLAKLQHKNLVRLLGFSMEGKERLLVYEFVKNRSLDKFIFDPIKHNDLDWETRYKIICGISKGLLYLHEESRLKIIHRDLKASNILLDGDMNPKIADFGMARLFDVNETQANTNKIVGTYGYMSPEYAMYGQFSAKSDVFSFGVLILEIVSGEQNRSYKNGEDVENLLSLVWKHWRQGTAEDIIDPVLLRVGSYTLRGILRCIHIGLLCMQDNPSDRPAMGSVVLMLSSSIISLPVPFEPTYSTTHGYNSRIPNFRGYGLNEFDSSGSSAFKRSSTQSTESLKTDMLMTGFRPT
ncbi:cysteine-rich receptor-like protein kinase 15 [Primulina huaijiensis]|uniref:cysteine-rich receptor-like protein kinase 15 n=1 Tax=Primulina huaijiensis TaxID=1492673 RepID=UPI003CC7539C